MALKLHAAYADYRIQYPVPSKYRFVTGERKENHLQENSRKGSLHCEHEQVIEHMLGPRTDQSKDITKIHLGDPINEICRCNIKDY